MRSSDRRYAVAAALFDVEKRYAEKMEFLSPLGNEGEGPGKRGYRLCEVIASDNGSASFYAVALRPWSDRSPESADQAGEVLTLIQQVRRASGGHGLIVNRTATPDLGCYEISRGTRVAGSC